VAADENVQGLADIPADRRLGARVASYGFTAVQRYSATLPQEQRWQILPYGDIDLMVERVVDGTIGGMIIYGPTFAKVMAEQPELDLHQFPLEPQTSARVNVGGIMLTTNTYLRSYVDEAIIALVEQGTIDQLVEDAGMATVPYSPGGY
jgi:polar amino acid transport system substrate-binding protein